MSSFVDAGLTFGYDPVLLRATVVEWTVSDDQEFASRDTSHFLSTKANSFPTVNSSMLQADLNLFGQYREKVHPDPQTRVANTCSLAKKILVLPKVHVHVYQKSYAHTVRLLKNIFTEYEFVEHEDKGQCMYCT